MKQKKAITILGIIILLCVIIGVVGLTLFKQRQDDKYIKTAKGNDISRYEWMEMLCEQSGLTEYQNENPYFKDVNASDDYFPYVQSAAEWKVLADDTEFEGAGYASGRFVVLTAMKTIGERKLQIYLDSEQTITDRDYIQMALEHDLIKKEELPQGISRESAEAVLEKISNLYYTEFWVDDYEKVKYQEGVVEIPSGDILNKKDASEITVSEEMRANISTGSIVIFQPDKTGMKTARRVGGIADDGTLMLKDNVDLDEVIDSLVVSDNIEVTAQDIFDYYGLQETYSVEDMIYQKGDAEAIVPTWGFSGNIKIKDLRFLCMLRKMKKTKKVT